MGPPKGLHHGEAVHAWHVDIADDYVRPLLKGHLETGAAISGHEDLEAFEIEKVFHHRQRLPALSTC